MFLYFIISATLLMPATMQLPPFRTRSFLASPNCDDQISSIEFLAEHWASSLFSCSVMCDDKCGCFGFHSLMKKCRIHRSCDPVNMTSTEDGWTYYQFDPPSDCKGIMDSGTNSSGFYVIDPFEGRHRLVTVYCDFETDNGGWTTIQRRLSGSIKFNRTWDDYKNGFGIPQDSYWIGNDVIHHLTSRQPHSLYVIFKLNNGTRYHQKYEYVSIGDESRNYQLLLAGPTTGSLGDRMINTGSTYSNLNGTSFSTLDRDNDRYSGHCATKYSGGWWFNNCHDVFLNGPWPPENWHDPWNPTIRDGNNIAEVRLMIKPT